jgi:hypothetical protein
MTIERFAAFSGEGRTRNVEIAGVTRPSVKSQTMGSDNYVFNAVGV